MTELVVTRGLPGCGKTTVARSWVRENPVGRHRVNRDDIRRMLNESVFEKGVTEKRVQDIRDASIRALLKANVSVINDDTNLPQRTVRDLARTARSCGAEFRIIDMTNTPLETCLERNQGREDKDPIAEHVILDMYQRYVRGKQYPLPEPEEAQEPSGVFVPYVALEGATRAFIVDIDGTLADKGDRDPHDESRVIHDSVRQHVADMVNTLFTAGYDILLVSGRSRLCMTDTAAWLLEHHIPYDALFMRPANDNRKDWIVKLEIFDKYIRPAYNVLGVFDDRNQVVEMWRKIGLQVYQVADGDF